MSWKRPASEKEGKVMDILGKRHLCAALLLVSLTTGARAGSDVFVAQQPAAAPPTAQDEKVMQTKATSGWAAVGSSGKLERGSNAMKAHHLGVGAYEVDFNSDVRSCGFTATVAGTPKLLAPGALVVAKRKGVSNGVYVASFDLLSLLPTDRRFFLNVTC
jgi:hypothetical protein